MSRRRTFVVTVLLLTMAAPLSARQGLPPVPRFEAGERVRYRMHLSVETRSTLGQGGQSPSEPVPLRLEVDMTWQLEALSREPEGGVKLRAVIEALTMESSAQTSSAAQKFVGQAVTYRLLGDGRVDSIEAPPEWLENGQPAAWVRAWLEQSTGMASGLPGHPVSAGDHWRRHREFDVEGLPRQRLVSESEYQRDEAVGSTPCASVLTRFELAGADSREETDASGARTVVERKVEGGGTRLSCYDLGNGRLLESTQHSREHIVLSVQPRPPKGKELPPAVVVESHTTTESHLTAVD